MVTPLVAMLYGRDEDYAPSVVELEKLFGLLELESPVYGFDKTEYYRATMGPALRRRFVTFKKLADPAGLADWKLATNALEERFARERAGASGVARPVNLDAGYLTGAKLVLASTKDFAHRIYLKAGIFAEITLAFRNGDWLAHEYTFPDYRAPEYHGFLKQARDAHLRKTQDSISPRRHGDTETSL